MTYEFRSFSIAAVSISICLAMACESQTTETPSGDGSADAAVSGSPVVPLDAERIVATAKGGSPLWQSDGSTCRSADNTFTFVFSSRLLTWKSCSQVEDDAGDQPSTWGYVEGEKTLSDGEAAPLLAALRAVETSSRQTCGADKPTLTLTVTTPQGDESYVDEFYACQQGPRYASGVDALFRELDALTSSSSQ